MRSSAVCHDHFVGVRKRDLERISDPQIAAINPTELFANTQLIKIFPKSKSIITVQDTDSIVDAIEKIGKNNITSVPVYSKSSRNHNKFLDVLDIVSFIHQELKNKNIDEKEAAKLDRNDLFKKIGLNDVKVSQVAQFNKRTNFYLFEDKAPARAVLDRICQSNLHRVPILDGEGGLYGVCSQTDLILFIHMHHRLFDDFQNKTVQEIGVGFQKVYTVKNTDSLLQAFAQIHEHNVSGIGVVDEKGSLIGAVSGSDVKLVGLDSDIHKLFIPYNTIKSETKEVVHVFPNDKFSTVIDKMVSQHVHRVFILDPNTKTPLGVISQVDVLKKVQEKLK